jgi:hypothetical protein
MITRIAQRTQDDCATCVVAMVMGSPYTYQRVLADSDKYLKTSHNGKFLAWWESYLRHEGFQIAYRPFSDLYSLPNFNGRVVGMLGMDFPHLRKSHIVAVDEFGIVDPADNAPAHITLHNYVLTRISDGALFHKEFLAVNRSRTDART